MGICASSFKKKEKKRKSCHCWDRRVDRTGLQSWQTKRPLCFYQCNFWLPGNHPPAFQTESIASWGESENKKKLWWQKQVSVFTDTVDSREWRQGSCGKGKDLKKKEKKKKLEGGKKVWKIISVMHSHFHEAVRWKDERKGVNHGYDVEYCKQEIRAAWNSTSVWTAIEASLAEDLHLNLLGCRVKCKHEQDAKIVN